MRVLLAALVAAHLLARGAGTAPERPHVLFMLADDLGFADVSFHWKEPNQAQIPTPHLQKLADEGTVLQHYYVQPVCSPTRATILSGRHVIHTGVYDPMNGGSGDLPLQFTLWPEFMKDLGYSTHAVGKWHLGYSSWRFTPVARGFDTYKGYLDGAESYWCHGGCGPHGAVDWWDSQSRSNMSLPLNPVFNETCHNGTDACPVAEYSASLIGDRAVELIHATPADPQHRPMFMYLAWQSVHSPLQAPQARIDTLTPRAPDPQRNIFAAMVSELDDGVGRVMGALSSVGMARSTLTIFSTDNGGPADGFNGNMACNWPLRGTKRTLFEGGVRGVGLIHGVGAIRRQAPTQSQSLVHAADWMHSVLAYLKSLPGPDSGNAGKSDPPMVLGDGLDLWDCLAGSKPWTSSLRTDLLHEAHPESPKEANQGNGHALRVGAMKVVLRSGSSWSTGSHVGSNDGWYGGVGSSDRNHDGYVFPQPPAPHASPTTECGAPPAAMDWALQFGNESLYACESAIGLGNNASACLFNISQDPCEYYDLSRTEPGLLQSMLNRLKAYRATAVDSDFTHNPDGVGCPETTSYPCHSCPGGYSTARTPCANGHPIGPPPSPPGPIPSPSFALGRAGQCVVTVETMPSLQSCDGAEGAEIWAIDTTVGPDWLVADGSSDGYLKVDTMNAHAPADACTAKAVIKLGKERGNAGTIRFQGFGLDNATGTIVSSLCKGQELACLVVHATELRLGSCSSEAAKGWVAVAAAHK